jgi:hypothetical protein
MPKETRASLRQFLLSIAADCDKGDLSDICDDLEGAKKTAEELYEEEDYKKGKHY